MQATGPQLQLQGAVLLPGPCQCMQAQIHGALWVAADLGTWTWGLTGVYLGTGRSYVRIWRLILVLGK